MCELHRRREVFRAPAWALRPQDNDWTQAYHAWFRFSTRSHKSKAHTPRCLLSLNNNPPPPTHPPTIVTGAFCILQGISLKHDSSGVWLHHQPVCQPRRDSHGQLDEGGAGQGRSPAEHGQRAQLEQRAQRGEGKVEGEEAGLHLPKGLSRQVLEHDDAC